MGESLLETPTLEENKMGDPMASIACLQQSVSFGRFEHDSLSWERWSTFPSNKYLEEVEKYSTPGSVAQKRAYFEAHYKRIAARKTKLIEQETNRENKSLVSDNHSHNLMNPDYKHSDEVLEYDKLETQSGDFTHESDAMIDFHYENRNQTDLVYKHGDEVFEVEELETQSTDSTQKIDVPSDGTKSGAEEIQVAGFEPGMSGYEKKCMQTGECVCLGKHQETGAVNELNSRYMEVDKELMKETEQVVIMEATKSIQKATSKTTTATSTKKKTMTPNSKGSAARMPKQSAAHGPKSPILSAPKSSKPVQSRTGLLPTTRPSSKKEDVPTQLNNSKKSVRPETKRVGPTSLHRSLTLVPGNPDPTGRKSLITESMGDKDIVKRAFKSGTPKMKNERISRPVKPVGPCLGQGTTVKEPLPGPRRNTVVDQRSGRSVPSFGSTSLNLSSNKSNQVSKKPERKSVAKETGGAHASSKSKIERTVEIRRTGRGSDSKSALSSSWNHGRVSRVLLKDDVKA